MQRFALIGAGFIGNVHATNLAAHPNVEFDYVYDVDAARAEQVAADHGARLAETIEEAFDPANVDAVFIASSTATHADNLRRAADAGVAALVEKPIDLDLAAARETVAYVEAAGIQTMVNFNRRFDRDHAALRRIVAAGQIGEVELIQLTARGPASPPIEYVKASGGQMRDQTVHFFDLARWIAGADPVEVFVAGSALADRRISEYGDVDTSVATLKLPSGALIQIDSVRRTGYGYDERIEVMGSTGLVESGRQVTGHVVRFSGTEQIRNGMYTDWFERIRYTYALALDSFVLALETGTEIPSPLRDGLKAQAIAEAATRSLASGRIETIHY
jgi:myo-inositol 2-dehydrogenase/D-chiro-inositol 1-dehydrogenase